MKNRLVFVSRILLLLFFTNAFAVSIDDGYQPIRPAQPTQAPEGKIEVVEVFWYGCPHCYAFEPYLEKWLQTKPDDVVFRRVPGVLNNSWVPHAKAYFTAEKLDILPKIHEPLFDAIHKDRKSIFTEDQLRDFFAEYGVDPDEFTKIYNSDEIETKTKQAFFMARGYRLTGVPSVVVNGKYMTSGSLAGSFENLLAVVNYLIDKERNSQEQTGISGDESNL